MEHGANKNTSLIDRAGVTETLEQDISSEHAWIEVIEKMDEVYADLVHYQVELEQKNSALEDAQQFINSVMASMTDVLIVCDIHGRIQQVNRALEVLTGKQEQDLLKHPLMELFGEESLAMLEHFPDKLGQDAIVDCEVSLIASDGQSAPLAMNCSSRYDHAGRLVGMVLIGRPVGELRRAYIDLNAAHEKLKQTQQQLVHSEKMASLGRLVAGVAHELNNPISFVFGNMHALKRYGERVTRYLSEVDRTIDSESLKQLGQELHINRILGDMSSLIDGTLEGAERVSDIVQDLRRYSGGQKEPGSSFDLIAVIQTATQWVLNARRVKPKIIYQLPSDMHVTGRKGEVHQILVNLVQNAFDVMEEESDSTLRISADKAGDDVLIKVHDSGPGIPQQDIARLFDPFYTTKAVGKGTGLGLYISYGLASEMGGGISAENHPRGGAVFTLLLPQQRIKGA